ncbi:L-threonylcarbamoyladenylate synthase [Salinisphaera sp.]|uniref:L-threonylcarbamoyladenylate synthase n=1 Tax=Salinisphaera sp. TaxID=1914330 RepID=UPI000C442418|nr:L-threonylcarbamoyladenylate synthase [Salinisphaera sp.]MBS62354.1 tRNA threonylcarbamoyladenosine biosynthesis protein RimN [Salinisphaera sp.]
MSRKPQRAVARVSPHRLRRAARILHDGGVVAHATEGVWGLACDPLDPAAVLRLLTIKHRDIDRGLIVIGADREQLAPFVSADADQAWARATDSWPAALTWLLPAADDTPWWLTGAHDTIALRQTAHADSAALCRAFGGALVSTSANVSARPPVRNGWQARARLKKSGGGVDMILGGVPDTPGRASTIRDARTGDTLRGG